MPGRLAGIGGRSGVPPGEVTAVGDQDTTVEAEAADVRDQGCGRPVDDQHAGFGVGQDVQDLLRRQPVVDGGEDRPSLGRAVEDLDELRAAGADEGDSIAGAHSPGLQARATWLDRRLRVTWPSSGTPAGLDHRISSYGRCAFTGTLSFVSGSGVVFPHLYTGGTVTFLHPYMP
jgi:hypothetical protein